MKDICQLPHLWGEHAIEEKRLAAMFLKRSDHDYGKSYGEPRSEKRTERRFLISAQSH
jgi:hypothetical protein